ncbi:hypothetical protein JCM10213_008560 [Rhodosporidiobolus nylandii]
MVDSRIGLARRCAHMTPAEFQAAQLESDSEDEERSSANEGPPHKRQKRQTYTAKDFQTPFALPSEVDAWFKRFPCLAKRNFYLIQQHHATSKHFDLRLHLDGRTVSWALPRKLPVEESGPGARQLAVETSPHPVSWTLVEGAVQIGKDVVGVWDLGEYKILPTKNAEKKREQAMKEGLDDAETTDEEASQQDEDEKQEDLFRDALHRCSFLATPAVEGRPGQPVSKAVEGKKAGFVIELNGERYKHLRLTLSRSSDEVKSKQPKGDTVILYREWLLTLSAPSPRPLSSVLNRSLDPTRSLLTSRTMSEIRADSLHWLEELANRGSDEESDDEVCDGDRKRGKEVGKRLKKEDGGEKLDAWTKLHLEGWECKGQGYEVRLN